MLTRPRKPLESPRPACGERPKPKASGEGDSPRIRTRGETPSPQPSPRRRGEGVEALPPPPPSPNGLESVKKAHQVARVGAGCDFPARLFSSDRITSGQQRPAQPLTI